MVSVSEDDLAHSLREFERQQHARQAAISWLASFDAALRSRNKDDVAALFHSDSHWRDVLTLTWDFSSARGNSEIAERLVAAQQSFAANSFHLPPKRTPPRHVKRLGIDSIEAIFEFSTLVGRGAGVLRLSPAAEGGKFKAWHLSTTLEALDGHEEKIGANRPSGSAYSRNFGGDNWADVRRKAAAYDDREPAVLVIGGSQAGLSIAARLNQLGVDTLVVDKWPRIGDSWRKRYHSLALHNSTHINHLPYLDFPPTFPKYIPKDMLGNWFEFYVDAMEINFWTDTEFVAGEWNEAEKQWTATLKRSGGSERVVRPRHLVFANGVSSYPSIPELPGLQDFAGTVLHSEGFTSGEDWRGKNALVLGTGSSANDIALDLHSHDVKTTMIQRGSTTVVTINPSARLNEGLWDETESVADADLIVASATPDLMIKGYQAVTKRMLMLDRDMIDGLKRIGFKHDVGEDETGHQMKYFRRGGGYNLDAGSSALMIKGEIGLLQYDRIEQFTAEGVWLKDGKSVPADLIVLATGYYPQVELVRRSLGEEMVDRIGPVWGLDANGELSNMFRRTPQQGLWFIAGGLPHVRINSKYLALQIKASELGILGALEAGHRPTSALSASKGLPEKIAS